MMIMYYTREKLLEVVKYAYPDKYDLYCKFFIDLYFKEANRGFSKYDFKKKKIIVNTLSRSSADIFISFLCELAKHIDVINRGETHYDIIYLKVLRKLLDSALRQHILEKKDLYRCTNEKLISNLQENLGSISTWKAVELYEVDHVYIRVYDSFMIRNILKCNKYYYDYDQNCWQKRVRLHDEDEELFMREYGLQAEFRVLKDNLFEITPVYKIGIITYAKEKADLLKSLNYRYHSEKNIWTKLIYAKDLYQEIDNIKDIPRQKTYITRNIKSG